MRPGVVDSNVLRVAEAVPGEWDEACALACIQYLQAVKQSASVAIDDAGRILSEYSGALGPRVGQPGVGSRFLQWLYQVQADTRHCEMVTITPVDEQAGYYIEFPADPDLAAFDRSDRKFVAVALASSRDPEIVNATDSDWWNHQDALRRNGLSLRFLFPAIFATGT